MAFVTAVDTPGEQRTWTVLGTDYLSIAEAEEFLEFLRLDGCSPNTLRSYAQSLGQYFAFLELADVTWRDVTISLFASFRRWLATGVAPGTVALRTDELKRSPATVDLRCAAVLSFYPSTTRSTARSALPARGIVQRGDRIAGAGEVDEAIDVSAGAELVVKKQRSGRDQRVVGECAREQQ